MTWNKLKPAGGDKLRLSDEAIRENWNCLEDALGRNHTFPGTKAATAGEHAVVEFRDQATNQAQESGLVKIWNNGGALRFIGPGGTVKTLLTAGGLQSFPSGTKMWFYQNTAPTGWTIDATPADALLAVKGGTAAFNVNGGTQAGIWVQPNHYHSINDVAAHGHTINAHTHTIATHDHSFSGVTGANNGNYAYGSSGDYTYYTKNGHTHNFSGETGGSGTLTTGNPSNRGTDLQGAHDHGGSTGGGATINSWRPLSQVGIICTKD